jgi:hypothetical protein
MYRNRMHPTTIDAPGLAASPIPRSRIAIGLAPSLRGRLEELAAGRAIVIDFFASRCCTSVWVGDITAGWLQRGDDRADLVSLAPIDGVAVLADRRLLDLLASAGPTLRLAGPTFARHLAVELEDAAAWLAFLETPAGHRRGRATGGRRTA